MRRPLAPLAAFALLVACSHDAPRLERAARPAVALSERAAEVDPVDYAALSRASRGAHPSRGRTVLLRRAKPGVEQWRAAVAGYSWPVETTLIVMGCESGGRADAVNPTPVPVYDRNGRVVGYVHAQGLMQILGGSLNGPANIRAAFEMWRDDGWKPWRASRPCSGVG